MRFTDTQIQDMLQAYRPWIVRKSLAFKQSIREDLVQEAMLEVWGLLKSYSFSMGKPPIDYLIKRRAHWRMLDIATDGKPYTGEVTTHRSPHTVKDTVPLPLMSDSLSETSIDGLMGSSGVFYEDDLSSVDFDKARHRIVDILKSALTAKQKKFVALRFYENWSYSEMATEFGYWPSGILTAQSKTRLKSELSEFRELVTSD
jgi:DNA-directed RNA polymerase specialized sigma24 family protein